MTGAQDECGGSLEIRSDVLSHLMHAGLSGTEWSLALAVIQQMSRRGEKAVLVSLREFHQLVRLDQEAIRKGLKTLRERTILLQDEPPSFTKPAKWSFNEDWELGSPWIRGESYHSTLCPTCQGDKHLQIQEMHLLKNQPRQLRR